MAKMILQDRDLTVLKGENANRICTYTGVIRFKAIFLLWIIALQAQPLAADKRQAENQAQNPIVVGELVWVDAQQGLAVAWMESRYITLDEAVQSLDAHLNVSGILEPSRYRNGRAYGLLVLTGTPQVGDRIVSYAPSN